MFFSISAQEKSDCESSKFEIKEVEAVKALVIKSDVPMAEIGDAMGAVYGQLFEYIEANDIQPAGPPFTVYLKWDPEGNVVFESGIPVSKTEKGEDNVVYKEYPKMKVLSTLYTGPYDKMEPVYNELMEYMKTKKLEGNDTAWEIYLTDPNEVAPEENKTIIYFPVK
jgi:effector-binding domain-containing protein